MSPIIILIVIAAYFLLLFGISYWAGRNADNAGFFSGNRSSNWMLVAMSTIGAAISGVTFVSVPGEVATKGFSYMQLVLGFTVGQFIVAYVLIPLYYKMNLTSIYEYLNKRFGLVTYKTGAWLFFVSKMLGASVRLLIVCLALHLLIFEPLAAEWAVKWGWELKMEGLFGLNVLCTVLVVYLSTFKGGVKSLIWTDLLKTLCLIFSVVLCIYYVIKSGVSLEGIMDTDMFFFDNPKGKTYFWKYFIGGIFLVVATTGLDQDLMQRSLSCKNYKDSQKNIITGALMQIVVIGLFLVLGWLLYTYAAQEGIKLPAKGDDVFPFLAAKGNYFPMIVGILFIVGFIAAAYSAAGSALTALTTSFTLDILGGAKGKDLTRTRKIVHLGMAIGMAMCIYVIYLFLTDSVVQTVYTLASYTYGPLLGMFMFGILMKKNIRDKWVPLVVILSPVLCFILDINSKAWFNGYEFSHEKLILNALFTFVGLCCLIKKSAKA